MSALPDIRLPRAALLIALCLVACAARAAGWPTIRTIDFAGNDVTRPETMQRELLVHVGDPADPAAIERSRQAVQDLGLFKSVEVESRPVDGGVRLLFRVHEKWYILPVPRVQGNSNGEYGYGGQLRWNNLWGLNHTLNVQATKLKLHDPDKTGQTNAQASYSLPFLDDTHYGVSGSLGYISQDSLNPQGQPYKETFENAQVVASYAFASEHPSKGWSVAGGLSWQRDSTSGPFAPPSPGEALGPVVYVTYDDLRYLIYSEEGQRFRAASQFSIDGLGSSYTASNYYFSYRRDWHVGDTPHQTVEFLGNTGVYLGGAPGHIHNFYSLGGARALRGYSSSFAEGDSGYYFAGAYLRPVHWDWLRLLVIAEAGTVYPEFGQTGGRPLYASIGVGLRLRINWLVNVEVEAGAAVPLVGGSGVRPFAGSVDANR
ncbi:MAG: POTRA domain-containing protein [Nevskia sp.]|nr:POTRA domain-containing protein [Nevskia sp.]